MDVPLRINTLINIISRREKIVDLSANGIGQILFSTTVGQPKCPGARVLSHRSAINPIAEDAQTHIYVDMWIVYECYASNKITVNGQLTPSEKY